MGKAFNWFGMEIDWLGKAFNWLENEINSLEKGTNEADQLIEKNKLIWRRDTASQSQSKPGQNARLQNSIFLFFEGGSHLWQTAKIRTKNKLFFFIILFFLESGLDGAGLDWDTLAGSSKWVRQSRARLPELSGAGQPEQSQGQAAIRLYPNLIAILVQATLTWSKKFSCILEPHHFFIQFLVLGWSSKNTSQRREFWFKTSYLGQTKAPGRKF